MSDWLTLGERVLVRESFDDAGSRVGVGQRLRYERAWYSVYDSAWCFEFRSDDGNAFTWRALSNPPPEPWWRAVFERTT